MIDFETYHRKNPHVFKLFRKYARIAKEKGFKRYSAKGIFEIIRWHTQESSSDKDYKLNNNYHAQYARKLMSEHPEFRGFFEIRTRRTNLLTEKK